MFSRVIALSCFCLSGCRQPPDYTVPVAEKKARVVRFCTLPGSMAEDLPADFEARTGIHVAPDTAVSMEHLTAAIMADPTRWDLVLIRDYAAPFLREWHLLTALDFGRLPGLKNLDWRFLDQSFDPGSRYTLPLAWGITVLAYRKDKIDPPPTSWAALWDEKYAGHVMMPDDPRLSLALALLSLGNQPDSMVEGELEAAGNALRQQAARVSAYGSSAQLADALADGSCWLAPLNGSDFALLLEPGDPIGWAVPAEGAPRWMDLLAIPRDAEHVEEAYVLMDYFLEPRPSAQAAAFLMRATPNKVAEPLVETALKSNPLIYPDADVLARCRFIGWDDPIRRRVLNTAWLDIRSQQPAAWAASSVSTNSSTP